MTEPAVPVRNEEQSPIAPEDQTVSDVQRRFNLLAAAAASLHSNGESSWQTTALVTKFSAMLGMPCGVLLRWDAVLLQPRNTGFDSRSLSIPAVASSVNMSRVQAVSLVIGEVCDGKLTWKASEPALEIAIKSPPSTLWLFVLACVAAACALAVLSGATHPLPLALIALSAGLGALLRRFLGRQNLGQIAQAFAAALLAGSIAGVAIYAHVKDGLSLLAVTPCMILVPGPHIINGSVDMLALRLSLGLARLTYVLWILGGICAGILLGLHMSAGNLPISQINPGIDLWVDVVCAGIAAASYGIFFSMPLRSLIWPVVAGMLAHAAHWWASVTFHANPAVAAGIAGLIVGTLLTPVAQRLRLPFAAIGFASLVSLMPGSLVFRMSSGLINLVAPAANISLASLVGTLSDGVNALLIAMALVLGLTLPEYCLRLLVQTNGELVL